MRLSESKANCPTRADRLRTGRRFVVTGGEDQLPSWSSSKAKKKKIFSHSIELLPGVPQHESSRYRRTYLVDIEASVHLSLTGQCYVHFIARKLDRMLSFSSRSLFFLLLLLSFASLNEFLFLNADTHILPGKRVRWRRRETGELQRIVCIDRFNHIERYQRTGGGGRDCSIH